MTKKISNSSNPTCSFSHVKPYSHFSSSTDFLTNRKKLLFLLVAFSSPSVGLAQLNNYINQHRHNQLYQDNPDKFTPAPAPTLDTPIGPTGGSSFYSKTNNKPKYSRRPTPRHTPKNAYGPSYFEPSLSFVLFFVLVIFVGIWFYQGRKSKAKKPSTSSSSHYNNFNSKKRSKKHSNRKASSSSFDNNHKNNNISNTITNSKKRSKILSPIYSILDLPFVVLLISYFTSFYSMISSTIDMAASSATQMYELAKSNASTAVDSLSEMVSNLTTKGSGDGLLEGEELIDLNNEFVDDDDDDTDDDSDDSEVSEDLTETSGNIDNSNSHTNNSDSSSQAMATVVTPTTTNSSKEANSQDAPQNSTFNNEINADFSKITNDVNDSKKSKKQKRIDKANRKKALEKKLKMSKMGGLYNEGNTCFMNSIIQSLGSLDSLDMLLDEIVNTASKVGLTGTNPVATMNLRDLIHRINTKQLVKHSYSANDLVRSMGKNSSRWLSADQEDAQEYFQQILSLLEKDTKTVLHPSSSESAESKPRHLTPFDGETAIRVGCLKCGETEGIRLEVSSSLGVSLESSTQEADLYDLLREYTKLEIIPGVECYRCSLVNLKNTLEKKISIKEEYEDEEHGVVKPLSPAVSQMFAKRVAQIEETLKQRVIDEKTYEAIQMKQKKERGDKSKQVMFARPTAKILPIHINRSVFDFNTGYIKKNTALVTFPEELDLSPFVVNDVKDPRNLDPRHPMIPVSPFVDNKDYNESDRNSDEEDEYENVDTDDENEVSKEEQQNLDNESTIKQEESSSNENISMGESDKNATTEDANASDDSRKRSESIASAEESTMDERSYRNEQTPQTSTDNSPFGTPKTYSIHKPANEKLGGLDLKYESPNPEGSSLDTNNNGISETTTKPETVKEEFSKTEQPLSASEGLSPPLSISSTKSKKVRRKPDPNSLIYKLKAVVVHYGTHNFGHYISYRKCRHNLWWKISDQNVTQVDFNTHVSNASGTFMLFYEHEYESELRRQRLKAEMELQAQKNEKLAASVPEDSTSTTVTVDSVQVDEPQSEGSLKSSVSTDPNTAAEALDEEADKDNEEEETTPGATTTSSSASSNKPNRRKNASKKKASNKRSNKKR